MVKQRKIGASLMPICVSCREVKERDWCTECRALRRRIMKIYKTKLKEQKHPELVPEAFVHQFDKRQF
jgi:hypothetical protein